MAYQPLSKTTGTHFCELQIAWSLLADEAALVEGKTHGIA